MRSSSIIRGVSATAAVLLLTACGGSDDEGGTASETTAATTSSAPAETTSAAPEADSEFCTEAADFGQSISSSFSGTEDPAEAEAQIRQAAEQIRGIEPPAEIADDWTALADGFERLADTVGGATSPNDPEAAAKLQQELQGLQEAGTNVQTYLQEECGIDTGAGATSGSAAPSS
jgi:hypothetical protein